MKEKELERLTKLKEIEKDLHKKGFKYICGIDEAGRGPLAGPVVVAGAIMPEDSMIEGVNDSKKVSEKKREILYDKIIEEAISYSVAIIDEKIIDEINILNATKERNYKLYPVILYAITKVVNNHIEFRMSLDENDNLGYYINVNPSYTIFHKDNNTFSNIWTKYDSSFEKFYNNYEKDIMDMFSTSGNGIMSGRL